MRGPRLALGVGLPSATDVLAGGVAVQVAVDAPAGFGRLPECVLDQQRRQVEAVFREQALNRTARDLAVGELVGAEGERRYPQSERGRAAQLVGVEHGVDLRVIVQAIVDLRPGHVSAPRIAQRAGGAGGAGVSNSTGELVGTSSGRWRAGICAGAAGSATRR